MFGLGSQASCMQGPRPDHDSMRLPSAATTNHLPPEPWPFVSPGAASPENVYSGQSPALSWLPSRVLDDREDAGVQVADLRLTLDESGRPGVGAAIDARGLTSGVVSEAVQRHAVGVDEDRAEIGLGRRDARRAGGRRRRSGRWRCLLVAVAAAGGSRCGGRGGRRSRSLGRRCGRSRRFGRRAGWSSILTARGQGNDGGRAEGDEDARRPAASCGVRVRGVHDQHYERQGQSVHADLETSGFGVCARARIRDGVDGRP